MNARILDEGARLRSLAVRDLTHPEIGRHALQLLVGDACRALGALHSTVALVRGAPVVSISDNYDRLRFAPASVTRDARYTRYVAEDAVLRTHMSALVPGELRRLATSPAWPDTTLVLPGIVYRRDCIDRLHSGEPHQMDVWRLRPGGARLDERDLAVTIAALGATLLPGRAVRTSATTHPYTLSGLQIDVEDGDGWVEIGECGLAHPEVLGEAGLDPDRVSGLAMGFGLDRILMLRKGIPDIRLLRAEEPRIAEQMLDLAPYRAVSSMPPVRRDMSIAIGDDVTAEELGDRIRDALGARASCVEEIAIVSSTAFEDLPEPARRRLGIREGQRNVLVRVVLRDLERTLTHPEANDLRNAIYGAIHEGDVHAWAT